MPELPGVSVGGVDEIHRGKCTEYRAQYDFRFVPVGCPGRGKVITSHVHTRCEQHGAGDHPCHGRNKENLIKHIKKNDVEEYFNLISWQPAEKIAGILSASDAAFLSFADNKLYSMTIPAKLQSYMACGIPILAYALGETKRVIEEANCGYVSEICQSDVLAEIIIKYSLLTNEKRNAMKHNAVCYCRNYFDKNKLNSQILRELDLE
jgi:glycosyltransferase involved in cell wall biosynthesis